MSLETYGKLVIEFFLVQQTLPTLIETLRKEQVPETAINESEALIFALFPFHVMAGCGHFGEHGIRLGDALISGATEYARNRALDTTEQLIAERLIEYAEAIFDIDELHQGRFHISENGLHKLARLVYKNITGTETYDSATLYTVSSHYTAVFSAWKGGQMLKQQYDLYLKLGDEEWLDVIKSAIDSEE